MTTTEQTENIARFKRHREENALTVKQMAALIGCSTSTVYRFQKTGASPMVIAYLDSLLPPVPGASVIAPAPTPAPAPAPTRAPARVVAPTPAPPTRARGTGRAGWLYVMRTPLVPDRVKVGLTRRTPQERLREFRTAAPEMQLVYSVYVDGDLASAERYAHQLLKPFHQRNEREHFRTNARRAYKACLAAALAYHAEEEGEGEGDDAAAVAIATVV